MSLLSDRRAYVIKAKILDMRARSWTFIAKKTMYGGRHIGVGDVVFLFASEHDGGQGLIARGIVTSAVAVARKRGIERQTPRVSVKVRRTGVPIRPFGREELKSFSKWRDGRPQTELNFKFYRQATNKVGGISAKAANYLKGYFKSG